MLLRTTDPFLISRRYPKLWRRLLLPVCRSTSKTISYTSLCSQHTVRLTALLCAVDKQQAVILVLLDLSAAFDTVDHDILLQRLHEEIGVCGIPLQWFESYLPRRKEAITINTTSSSECNLIYEVPQGSVLGPILFTCYTKPLGAIAREHGPSLHIYADDTHLYIAVKLVGGVS